ncbi:MAG: aldo/keto reductase [Phycisphaeraceae bacterium]|nr:aldo/keto reductase [Phycisphaeraceae bacterium]
MAAYIPDLQRYTRRQPTWFRRCGRSGLKLPAVSLGLWHNFGESSDADVARRIIHTAFDHGITHFDLANNYGPPPGSAESRFADILPDLPRDEIIVSTKAGYLMWPGPYGEWGSRKYMLASLDQSLKRLKLDYVDIFYHHRPDPDTPVEESLSALDTAVRQGKAIYAGISNYNGRQTALAAEKAKIAGMTPLLIHQVHYNMLARSPETDVFPAAGDAGLGVICFCPLAQGVLTDRYLGDDIPGDSRAADPTSFLKPDRITPQLRAQAQKLNDIARQRGQTLAQMALTWVLRDPRVTSALIGASKPQQVLDNVKALDAAPLGEDELKAIECVLTG